MASILSNCAMSPIHKHGRAPDVSSHLLDGSTTEWIDQLLNGLIDY